MPLFCMMCAAGYTAMTDISYEITALEDGRWEYSYEVTNLGLSIDGSPADFEEFTIWFDAGLYDNLTVTTAGPLLAEWDQIVWQPEPLLLDAGAFDAICTSDFKLGIGQSIDGFSVAFDWLGQGTPGFQYYEIVTPETLVVVDSGFTIPEPASVTLFVLAGLVCAKHKRYA